MQKLGRTYYFYPRSPRGERRVTKSTSRALVVFLSTLPARGATTIVLERRALWTFLSTLPARGATLKPSPPFCRRCHFYPRSPRGERRCKQPVLPGLPCGFLSTLPARGATQGRGSFHLAVVHFYPRSPRGERPAGPCCWTSRGRYFYPRSPRGERPEECAELAHACLFLSTLPARGATVSNHTVKRVVLISIHAPREGSDHRLLR